VLYFQVIDRKLEVMQHYVFGSTSRVRKTACLEEAKELTELC